MQSLLTILSAFWSTLAEMAPWLLFGFFAAGVLSVFFPPSIIERHLGRGGRFWGAGPVVKASVLGVPLPICSCGVIPVGAGLYRHGASRGATSSFLLSTPQTGVDSIFATYALMGPVFAVVRPVVALVTGIVGGLVIDGATRNEAAAEPAGPQEQP
ncbi:MAG: permease, partial [Planctomycetota bacterium]